MAAICHISVPKIKNSEFYAQTDLNHQMVSQSHSAWSESWNTRRSDGVRTGSSIARTNLASRPVAQPSRATGRPFGKKYDNIDHNKAKKEGPGCARGQTRSRNMAATRLFFTRRPRLPIWSPTHHSVYLIPLPSFSVNIKSRPKYTSTSGFANPLQVWPRRFSNYGQFHDFSDHFMHFWKYFRFLNCTLGPQI